MKKRLSFWDILAWIVLFGIFIWLVLKMLGIINTPILLEYAPYFGAVYIAGWAMSTLRNVSQDVKDLKQFKYETINQIHSVKENCARNHK